MLKFVFCILALYYRTNLLHHLSSDYEPNSLYYYGIEHDYSTAVNLTVTIYTSECLFWNVTSLQWESTGCKSTLNTTRQQVACACDHLTSFSSSLKLAPNPLDFSVLKVSYLFYFIIF